MLILLGFKLNKKYKKKEKNICRDKLTDNEYLKHMIPHHQVAVDISILLQKKTKNPMMQKILRELIWTQNYEILLMKDLLNNNVLNVTRENKINQKYKPTITDFEKPNYLEISNTHCDPHFFDPEKHMEHLKHMKLTDEMYIKHMIPHHQVAVDMSKVLLKNTKNDFMIYLAYRIIRSQQKEILLLNDLLKKENVVYSNLII
tara:strand:- start:24 stop:629 length:606 start_codon:yes stop_codon:yes gene_type:complete